MGKNSTFARLERPDLCLLETTSKFQNSTKCLLLHGILTITIWHISLGNANKTNLSPLNKVHNRILKIIQ